MHNPFHKPILFVDFDRTLCHDRFWRSANPHLYSQIQNVLFGDHRIRVHAWMEGVYTSEDIVEFLAQECSVPFRDLWDILVHDCETMHVSLRTLADINALRDHFWVVLFTDNMDCFSRFTVPALHLNDYFDEIMNSYDAKTLKKNLLPQMMASVPDQTCCLIDDGEAICMLCEELGGVAYRITSEKTLDHHLAVIAAEKN
ncbi:MAG: hypothetical protein KGI50_04915 [Patescibacteria group bacterium]|nr:hypothetical protein [Patescibacteria group bacterium]MDE2438619.1 hypothetical protein [Patescibacteria group bacterium]